ncbi:MAG: GspH/FimT family pseudopilin [Gammaproteobacteria bacterium]|nr:GspH/FimT family pseudopilin [Gammaproteobacteria bacterium]
MKTENGFTLIELLTAMGVATILIAVAIPGMQAFQQNARQSSSATDLVNGMRIARNTAITTNTRVTVCASANGNGCENTSWNNGWIAFIDLDADRVLDNNETMIRSGTPADGVNIQSGQFSTFFVYRPNGRVMFANVAQNSGQFMICDDRGSDHAKGIRVDLSGRPRIYDADSGGLPLSCG